MTPQSRRLRRHDFPAIESRPSTVRERTRAKPASAAWCPSLCFAAGVAVLLGGCASGPERLTLHVRGAPARHSTSDCTFVLRARIAEGGTQTACLTAIVGVPAPNATMHSGAVFRFALPGGTIRVRAVVTQRFAADGAHARQKVSGVVMHGDGKYAGRSGSLTGGGTLVDTRSGVRDARLTYRLVLRR